MIQNVVSNINIDRILSQIKVDATAIPWLTPVRVSLVSIGTLLPLSILSSFAANRLSIARIATTCRPNQNQNTTRRQILSTTLLKCRQTDRKTSQKTISNASQVTNRRKRSSLRRIGRSKSRGKVMSYGLTDRSEAEEGRTTNR